MKNITAGVATLLLALCNISVHAQTRHFQTTICNPLNLSYRFQPGKPSRREAADPVCVLYKDKYLLFASKSGGYWSSENMIDWNFITTKDLPLEDYAPAAMVIGDTVYFMGLDKRIYKSGDPLWDTGW